MEKVDLSRPGPLLPASIDGVGETEEVERIELAFLRMMRRLEPSGGRPAAPCCGPGAGALADRPGPPRRGQPGADRDPAAARGDDRDAPSELRPSCRRPSGSPPRRWRSCSSSPASCARPRSTTTASCRRSPRRSSDFGAAHGITRASAPRRPLPTLADEEQLVIYRVTQESLSNIAQHASASTSSSCRSSAAAGHRRRRPRGVSDDGRGFELRRVARRSRPLRHARARAAGRRRLDDLLRARRGDHDRTTMGACT